MVSPIQRNESLQASPNIQPARRNPQGTVAAAQQVASQLAAQLPNVGGNSTTRVRPAEAQETQGGVQASKRQRLHHIANGPKQVEEIKNLLQLPKETIKRVLTFLDSNSRNHSLVLVNKELKNLVREQQYHEAQQIGALSTLPKETIERVLTFLDSNSRDHSLVLVNKELKKLVREYQYHEAQQFGALSTLPKKTIKRVLTFLDSNSKNTFALANKAIKNMVRQQQRVLMAPANELNQALIAFPNVEQIKFTRTPSVEDVEGIHDSERIGQIKHLDLSTFNTLTDEALTALVSKFPNVTSVDLSLDARLSDAGLIAIAQGWPNLTSLNTSAREPLSEVGIVALAQGCPNLTHLDLTGQRQLSNACIVALAEGCPNLATLDMDFCEQISDDAVIVLAQRCPNLTRVCLTDSLVTDDAVEALAAGCPNLSELFLEGCEGITDEVFYTLAGRYTNFQTFAVGNVDQDLSGQAIDAFLGRNPNVELILWGV